MAKKSFVNPFLLLLDIGGDEEDEGANSGQGTLDPCSFDTWNQNYPFDYDKDGDKDFDDYKLWWKQYIKNDEAWSMYNPGVPLYDTEPVPDPDPEP